MQSVQRYTQLAEAIECERKEEQLYYDTISKEKTLHEKNEVGLVWYPLSIENMSYTLGEFIEIEIERPEGAKSNKMKTGQGCVLYRQQSEDKFYGHISYVNKKVIKLIIKSEAIVRSEFMHHKDLILEATYDDRPYKIMTKTIETVMHSQDPMVQLLREYIDEEKDIPHNILKNKISVDPNSLNKEQIEAITGSINSVYMSIIHGPPGTGKTTTLVQLIKQLSQTENKILACAPSNKAVDLLARELHKKGVNVLRIGNITRIGDAISHLTLEDQMRNHKEWSRIKKVKIEAAETKKSARAFKRNFGYEEREERKKMLLQAKELVKWARDLEDQLVNDIVTRSQVICTTLISCDNKSIRNLSYDTMAIDEASQALEPECWVGMLKSKRIILAGDHKQLPPTIKSKEAEKLGLATTILDKMASPLSSSFLLRCQYRMNEDILAFPNKLMYEGKLYTAEEVKNRKLSPDGYAVSFVDTVGCGFDEEYNYENRSVKNPGEYSILREILIEITPIANDQSIGIISPYAEK